MKAIDLFAGAGGFTAGAERAGARVIWVANHWPLAVEYHAKNHPKARHVCQDLHQVDWHTAPDHGLLLASPACQGHSDARHGNERPYHDALRSTAWAVVSCLEVHRTPKFVVENVPGFSRWELFPVWKAALERLGYHVNAQVLNAADFGVPQSRKRLFITGSLKRLITLEPGTRELTPAASIFDWSSGNWKPASQSKSPLVRRQWRNGRKVHGRRFLIGYHSYKTHGHSLGVPMGTVTTKRSWAIVDGNHYRMLTLDEYRRAMGFPTAYALPPRFEDALKMLGNAVPPALAAGVVRQVMAG